MWFCIDDITKPPVTYSYWIKWAVWWVSIFYILHPSNFVVLHPSNFLKSYQDRYWLVTVMMVMMMMMMMMMSLCRSIDLVVVCILKEHTGCRTISIVAPLLFTSGPARCEAVLHGLWDSPLCLFYAIVKVFYHGGDMMYGTRRRKPKPALKGIFNLPRHIGMVWEELAFDDAVSYTQWWKCILAEVMAWGIKPPTLSILLHLPKRSDTLTTLPQRTWLWQCALMATL